jgi:hypothetical protein
MRRQNGVINLINLDIKKEIISKRESGKGVGDLSAEYGVAKSTIVQFKKEEEEGRSKKCTSRERNRSVKQFTL